jgi:uncharacterized cupredoxin-like copper-binding protein
MIVRSGLAAWILALLLAGCGGTGAKTRQTVIMSDFSFSPAQITVPAGQQITLEISNSGAVVHNFIIMKAGADVGKEFDEADSPNEYWRIELQPGASETRTFTAPSEPGEYLIACSTPGHLIAGMTGKLVVVAQ